MYTPHTDSDIEQMLAAVGVPSLEELVRVPDAVALRTPLDVPKALPEPRIAAPHRFVCRRQYGAAIYVVSRSGLLPALRAARSSARLRCAANF